MTTRSSVGQWVRELKVSLVTRVIQRATSSRTTGLDSLAKQMVARSSDAPDELDEDFDHPKDWDRPID